MNIKAILWHIFGSLVNVEILNYTKYGYPMIIYWKRNHLLEKPKKWRTKDLHTALQVKTENQKRKKTSLPSSIYPSMFYVPVNTPTRKISPYNLLFWFRLFLYTNHSLKNVTFFDLNVFLFFPYIQLASCIIWWWLEGESRPLTCCFSLSSLDASYGAI